MARRLGCRLFGYACAFFSDGKIAFQSNGRKHKTSQNFKKGNEMKINPVQQMIAEAINSKDPAHNVALVCTEIVRGLSFIAHAIPDKEEQDAFIETISKQIRAELEILNQSTSQFEA